MCFFSVLCLLCLCARLFICALWSPAGKGMTSWLSFVMSNFEFVTFLLVSWVRGCTWLYWFLIFAPLLTLFCFQSVKFGTSLAYCLLSNDSLNPPCDLWQSCDLTRPNECKKPTVIFRTLLFTEIVLSISNRFRRCWTIYSHVPMPKLFELVDTKKTSGSDLDQPRAVSSSGKAILYATAWTLLEFLSLSGGCTVSSESIFYQTATLLEITCRGGGQCFTSSSSNLFWGSFVDSMLEIA